MELILIIEMLAVAVLGFAFISQTKVNHSLEAKIKALNSIIQARNEELNQLKKCQH